MNRFAEGERIRKRFRILSGGRFHIVYQALCDCAPRTPFGLMNEDRVAERIKEIVAQKADAVSKRRA